MKFLICFLFSVNLFAAYTEKEIESHIGPYNLKNDKYKNCPKEISLFAHCSLGTLTLDHSDNPDFVYLKITSLNKGEKVTMEGKNKIEEFNATYRNKVIRTKKTIYLPHGSQFSEKALLKLKGDLLEYSLVYLDEKKTREIVNCVYKRDHARWKKQIEELCKKVPDAYDCKK